jgi:hypothetical protein
MSPLRKSEEDKRELVGFMASFGERSSHLNYPSHWAEGLLPVTQVGTGERERNAAWFLIVLSN